MNYHNIPWTSPGRYNRICETNGWHLQDYLKGENLRVLDVGCSVGIETARISAQNPQHRFTGLDIRPDLIEIAKTGMWSIPEHLMGYQEQWDERDFPETFHLLRHGEGPLLFRARFGDSYPFLQLKGHPLPNVNYVVGDYSQTEFTPGSFNLVLGFVCGLEGNSEKVIQSLMDLLVEGGTLITERSIHTKNNSSAPFFSLLRKN